VRILGIRHVICLRAYRTKCSRFRIGGLCALASVSDSMMKCGSRGLIGVSPSARYRSREWLKTLGRRTLAVDGANSLMTINEAIAERVLYKRRIPAERKCLQKTLRKQSRALAETLRCDDGSALSHIFLRALGSRTVVNGSIRPSGWTAAVRRLTHALVQTMLPGSGWVEFDPTKG